MENVEELLQYAVENGMIDTLQIRKQIEMNKREELLKKHVYQIYQTKSHKWATYLPDRDKKRVQRVRNTREEIEDLVVEYWKAQMQNPTIQEVFDEWNDRRLSLQKIAKSTHMRNQVIFRKHYAEFGKRRIKDIREDEITDFLEEQIPKYQMTSKAYANLKSITKGFLLRAKKRKLIDFKITDVISEMDVTDQTFRKVIKEDYEEVFSEEETYRILKYLMDNMDVMNTGIILLFITGMRVGELVALKHEHIQDNVIKIRGTETQYKGEDGKYVYEVKPYPKSAAGVRSIVIPRDYMWICGVISKMNPFGEYIFTRPDGQRIPEYSIRSRLKRICKKLGIYVKSPHKIRKTYCTILLDNHVDNKTVMEQMGHADINCSESYYHRNRKSIDDKMRIISAIEEFQLSAV